jgi:hypothetical protein
VAEVPASTLAFGLRVARERLVSGCGAAVNGDVTGVSFSLAGGLLSTAVAPQATPDP